MGFVDFPLNELGVPPCWRAYFLLLRQKKVAKEKATPGSAPATPVPCATRRAGRLAKLACGSDNASRLLPARLRCSAPLMGTLKSVARRTHSQIPNCFSRSGKQPASQDPSYSRVVYRAPWEALSNAGTPGAFGEDCLRAKPEFRSRPAFRVAQGTGEAGAAPGSPSFCLLFLGEARKSETPRKGGTPSQLADPRLNREPSDFKAQP